jgi:hypothetical protein
MPKRRNSVTENGNSVDGKRKTERLLKDGISVKATKKRNFFLKDGNSKKKKNFFKKLYILLSFVLINRNLKNIFLFFTCNPLMLINREYIFYNSKLQGKPLFDQKLLQFFCFLFFSI